MKQYFFLQKLIAFSLFIPSFSFADETVKPSEYSSDILQEPGALTIKPPPGWKAANSADLPPRVKMMIVGTGKRHYPPSINIGTEPYRGTIKDYLLMVKRVNESLGAEWRNLGSIKTQSGKASLSQVDMNTEWGPVRLMHVILIKNRTVYIVTAGALKEEFSFYYKDFFDSFKSIQLNPDVFELVSDRRQQQKLVSAYHKLLKQHDKPKNFDLGSDDFQKKYWKPFLTLLENEYGSMGSDWMEKTKQKIHRDLTAEYE
ncbi:MAG: hypothetical protein K940chlam3_00711 [Chlamydiae bacterium]|nr:hypothetical protein [Chlamydiota bacterium]